MKITVYHYPKCSTSSAALQTIKNLGLIPNVVLYCETGLSKSEILNIMRLLGQKKPIGIVKRNGLTYRHLGLAHKNLTDEEWIEVITQNPKLIKRPIIVLNDTMAIVGKDQETVEAFLSQVKTD